MLFRRVRVAGQEKLVAARVLVVGVGATGGAIANSLARAGVGLTLVDRDFPERHNLQRQTLFTDADVERGIPKAVAAAEHLRAIDPELSVEAHVTDVHAGNILGLAAGHDVLIDGTDNFATRFVVNDAAVKLGIPWVYCGAIGALGALMTIEAGGRPCLRCLYPDPPPPGSVETCDTAGVLHPVVAVVGGLAALEAMKLILGETPRQNGLLHIDVWEGIFQAFKVQPQPDCPTCAKHAYPALDARDGDLLATSLCGRDAVHVRPPESGGTAGTGVGAVAGPGGAAGAGAGIDLAAIARRLAAATEVGTANDYLVRFTADGHEITLFADGRAIIQGTDDPAVARAVYARWVGV
jgi:molybdopterin/thiamine biosynthesis adenylyltransferase